ncbi:EamA family transporter [bacterium]|nr:EamA family transporter [bacterium]
MLPRTRGILFAQLNALCAGLSFATGLQVTDHIPVIRFVALMYLITAPANLLWWWSTHADLTRKLHAEDSGLAALPFDVKGMLWLAFHTASSVAGIFWLWVGIAQVGAAVGSLLSRLEIVVAIVLGLWLLRERFSKRHWLGFAFTLCGMAVIRWTVIPEQQAGFVYLLLGAAAFGLAEFSGKVAVKYVPVPRLVLIRAWIMAACLVLLWWRLDPGWTPLSSETWLWLVLSAVLGPLLARNNYMLALSYLPVSQVVLLNQAQPIYAALGGWLLRAEAPAWQLYLGGAAIILGNAVLIKAGGQRAADAPKKGRMEAKG